MNPSTASTAPQHAATPPDRPAPLSRDERHSAPTPTTGGRNPAPTDNEPIAVLGYN